uniref:glucan endo-1,3-beta-D-glucosidase n=1 Tax=Picea sitchensis TaxID=3332 RepID=B8LKM5_PICSI|nr:unknown [Picea sitchensis]
MAASSRYRRMQRTVPLLFALLVAAFGHLVILSAAADSGVFPPFYTRALGINYGRVADNLPSPSSAVALIKNLQAGYVKIYDADPQVLSALSNTALQVTITVRNQDISNISSSPTVAEQWVQANVLPHYPSTLITAIMVGNEVLSDYQNQATWLLMLPAMPNIHASLLNHGLADSIKVTTSLAMDVLSSSYPPSEGTFRNDVASPVLQPLLDFVNRTGSFVFLDIYPFFAWSANPANVTLDYATFSLDRTAAEFDDAGLSYSNMLDAQLDAVLAAMGRLGFPGVNVVVGETGWPTKGDENQQGTNVPNATRYNQQLVQKVLADPPRGTPRRPGAFIPTFIFSLFNEDQKPGPNTERNWGLFYPDGTPVYPIVLSNDAPALSHISVPSQNNGPLPASPPSPVSPQWCVVSPVAVAQVDETSLQAALDYACGAGADCSLIEPGEPCYLPNTLVSHASYAFNSYWQKTKAADATCDFHGAAVLTSSDPSVGDCVFDHM